MPSKSEKKRKAALALERKEEKSDDGHDGSSQEEPTPSNNSNERRPQNKRSGALLDSSTDIDEEDSQDIVNVDFQFFDPKPEDYHGVKALLRLYLDETQWDLGGLVDIILSQTTVGTVIKTAEDESPIGVISALNLGRYQDQSCVKSIYQFLCSKCNSKSDVTELETIFKDHPSDVGLLISERLINMPEELAPPLYQGLFDEISWAIEDEPKQELRDFFKFKFYLIMTHIFQQLPRKALKRSKKKSAAHNQIEPEVGGEIIYTKPEDQLFHELSRWSCKFPVTSTAVAAHEIQGLRQYRLVMVLDATLVEVFRSRFCVT